MIIEAKQTAGYEVLLLVFLLMGWVFYKYWKLAKPGELAAEMEMDDPVLEEDILPEPPAAKTPAPFLDIESSLYGDPNAAPMSSSLKGNRLENYEEPMEESSEFTEFDPRKAVIWSEVLKRPYC